MCIYIMKECVQNMLLLIWLIIVTLSPFIFAIINIHHSIQFHKLRRYQFINCRKPKLLMLYTILVSISLFMVTPMISLSIYIIASLHRVPPIMENIFVVLDAIYGSIVCTLLNIIAVRVWLLFYDHKFAIATVDRTWRKSINPSENNFFLNHKKTLGNDAFFLRLVFAMWIIVLLLIVLIVIAFDWSAAAILDEYIFIALRLFIAIPVAIFIFTICNKIKRINDEFHLRQEMQSLGKWVLFLTISAVVAQVLIYSGVDLYIFQTAHLSFDLLFIVCTAYIQTKSALNSFSQSVKKFSNTSDYKQRITMVDVLRNQNAFEAFMRHCVNELSVESLLFLVEVAQYKATLCKHNAPDPISQFYSLNVQKVNLRGILLDSRFEQRLSVTSNSNDPFLSEANSSRQSNKSRGSLVDFVNSRSSTGATATAKKENKFRQFQQSILDRKWLPISFCVAPINAILIHTPMTSKSMRNLRILAADTAIISEMKQLKLNKISSNKADPQEDVASIIIHPESHSPESVTQLTPKSSTSPGSPSISVSNKKFTFKDITIIKAPKTSKSAHTPNCTVSAIWIKDFASFLYQKYIKYSAEHSVNISSATTRFLTQLFSRQDDLTFFEFIVQHSGGDIDANKCPPAAIDEQLLINTYLYHIFDGAFDEIWSLLRMNAFLRFSVTDEYKRLLQEEHEKESKETNGQRLSRVMREAIQI